MFTIKECTERERACAECDTENGTTCALAARLCACAEKGDRIFVLNENGPRVVGVLGLRHGKVIVKGVCGDIDEQYRDLMIRALLNACTFMNPITVRGDSTDGYFKRFGFVEKDGGMEVKNTDIRFH